jgi:hypothetical protein
LADHWSAELTEAVAEVAWTAATNTFARAAVDLWIRGGAGEMITLGMGDLDLWVSHAGLAVQMWQRPDLLAGTYESIRTSLSAVETLLDV